VDLCDLYARMPADHPGIAELGVGWTVCSGVAVRRAGAHVSLLEVNGYHGADAARVADLSRHGTALSFRWNARGSPVLIGAARGAVGVRVDPSLPIDRPQREALAGLGRPGRAGRLGGFPRRGVAAGRAGLRERGHRCPPRPVPLDRTPALPHRHP
jgi:hypothetical protein